MLADLSPPGNLAAHLQKARADDQIGAPLENRPHHLWNLLWIVLPIAVQQHDGGRFVVGHYVVQATLERGALAAVAGHAQHLGARSFSNVRRLVGGAIVNNHDHIRIAPCGNNDATDKARFVVGSDQGHDNACCRVQPLRAGITQRLGYQ